MNKLQEKACGKNANGCFKEPSAEVRQAAKRGARCLPAEAAAGPAAGVGPFQHGSDAGNDASDPAPRPRGSRAAADSPARRAAAARARALPVPPSELKKPLEVPAEPPRSSAARPAARPVTSYAPQQPMELPAAPLPPSILIPAALGRRDSYQPQQPLAMPGGHPRGRTCLLRCRLRSPAVLRLAIVDIKPVAYEAPDHPPPSARRRNAQERATAHGYVASGDSAFC